MAVARKSDLMHYDPTYPNTFECVCGREAKLTKKDVSTRFKGETITIKNVPSYECSFGHIKTARVTRVRIKSLLKEAYNDKLKEIDYK
ncbi:YgiT-type zinc finger protein [Pseudobacillus badius]|uniref:YgiT-type zinc finger protein n=1 Tax=Bacillus badius TaxID=1455 RepID=UPI003CF2E6C0